MTRKFLPVLGRRDLLRYGERSRRHDARPRPHHRVRRHRRPCKRGSSRTRSVTRSARSRTRSCRRTTLRAEKISARSPTSRSSVTAFDGADATHPPAIYAGGPFSGRAPFADDQGQPSANFPPNSFANFLFLDRVKDAGWRLAIIGPSALPVGQPNVGVPLRRASIPAIVGLRDQLKAGLADAMQGSIDLGYGELATLSQNDLVDYLNKIEASVPRAHHRSRPAGVLLSARVRRQRNLGGWKLAHFEGDPQPLGYSVWSTAKNKYVERADAPMSTPQRVRSRAAQRPTSSRSSTPSSAAFPTYAKKFSHQRKHLYWQKLSTIPPRLSISPPE